MLPVSSVDSLQDYRVFLFLDFPPSRVQGDGEAMDVLVID
jgi:hypothetical protein